MEVLTFRSTFRSLFGSVQLFVDTRLFETFPRVFCFRKSCINENSGNQSLVNHFVCCIFGLSPPLLPLQVFAY